MDHFAPPRLRFAFEARVDIAPSRHVGHAGSAPLGFTPITGGTVAGPRLQGTVEPGSSVKEAADERPMVRLTNGNTETVAPPP